MTINPRQIAYNTFLFIGGGALVITMLLYMRLGTQ